MTYHHVQRKSGVGSGAKTTAISLTPGKYIFHSLVAKSEMPYPVQVAISIRRTVAGMVEYTMLGGGWMKRGSPVVVGCPYELVLQENARLYSQAYQLATTDYHYLDTSFEKVR